MNNKELKNETWKFLRNISVICFLTISFIIYVIIKNVNVAFFVTLLFWPLIILLLQVFPNFRRLYIIYREFISFISTSL